MANLPPSQEELFRKIEKEHIKVNPVLWTIIYQYIGDCVTAISFLLRYYIDNKIEMPKDDARRILVLVKRIIDIIEKITHHELIKDDEKDGLLVAIKLGNLKLDPATDELFGNYVRNDIHVIDLMVSNFIDPLEPTELMPVETVQRILDHVCSTMHFMKRLREATSDKKGYDDDKNINH